MNNSEVIIEDHAPDVDPEQIDREANLSPLLPSGRTDAANAARFVREHEGTVVYVAKPGDWLVFDETHWKRNELFAQELAKKTAESYWKHISELVAKKALTAVQGKELIKWAVASNGSGGIASTLKLAKSDKRILRDMGQFNRRLNLFNALNGTLDIDSRELREHRPDDMLTQIANVKYDLDAKCPDWDATLRLIFDNNDALVRYVRALIGYSLSGTRKETILPICWGDGNNGKSTVWNPVVDILGDYATLASQDLLIPSKQSQHPADKAQLFGKRFVAISEVDHGRYFSESRVKELTGDSLINCRGMYEDFWTFEATHTFWMAANHLPRVSGTDEGIWRRLKPIPFTVNVPQRAAELGLTPRKNFAKWLVKNESSGILNWILDGYADYMENGLVEPECVQQAAESYRHDEDRLGLFADECCVLSPNATVSASDLFAAYQSWGGQQSNTTFGKEMSKRFEKTRSRHGFKYRGIGLRAGCEEPAISSFQANHRVRDSLAVHTHYTQHASQSDEGGFF